MNGTRTFKFERIIQSISSKDDVVTEIRAWLSRLPCRLVSIEIELIESVKLTKREKEAIETDLDELHTYKVTIVIEVQRDDWFGIQKSMQIFGWRRIEDFPKI